MDINKIIERHKQTVSNLLLTYDGKEPLHLYLRKYFATHKKHGSKDRKLIAALIYSYFRLGENVLALQNPAIQPALSLTELLDISFYICDHHSFPQYLRAQLQQALEKQDGNVEVNNNEAAANANKPKWPQQVAVIKADAAIEAAKLPIQRFELIQKVYPYMDLALLFPFKAALSEGLDRIAVAQRILMQPPVFLRIRPTKGNADKVLKKVADKQLAYTLYNRYTLSMPASTPVQQYLAINKEVVIQDSSSQSMDQFMQLALAAIKTNNESLKASSAIITAWDACAASGGKSILLHDLCYEMRQKLSLTVTDIRPTILKNLESRFKEAGITHYNKGVLDLLTPAPLPFKTGFDLVICDVPCSGSGTWARNPENIYYFSDDKIQDYYNRQIGIASKAWQAVRPGGYFLYMTCSVFEQENEAVSRFIATNSGMELITQKVIMGQPENNVSMFGALYTRKK